MKKMLSVLSVLALLLILFSVCAPIIGAEDVTVKSPLIADYTTKAKFNASTIQVSASSVITLSYDSEGAAKITYEAVDSNSDGRLDESWIRMTATNEMAVKGNEVIVAKVKVNSDADFLTYSHRSYHSAGGYISYKAGNENHSYTSDSEDVLVGEDGWVYVAYTIKDTVDAASLAASTTWTQLWIIANGYHYENGDTISIAWVGAFKDLETAKLWDLTDSTEKRSDFFFDYTQGVNTTDKTVPYMAVEQANQNGVTMPTTSIEYDATMKAMKVSTMEGYTMKSNMAKIHFFDPTLSVSTSVYPIFAMKIKMNITTGGAMGAISRNDANNAWKPLGLAYQNNTDWQLVYIDASNIGDPSRWRLNIINLINNNTTDATLYDGVADTVAYIEWAGAFSSVDAAKDYFAVTTEQEEEFPKEVVTNKAASNFFVDFSTQATFNALTGWSSLRARVDGSVTGEGVTRSDAGVTFDTTENAAKMVKKEGATEIQLIGWKTSAEYATVSLTDYPVLAIKVKMNTKSSFVEGLYAQNIGGTYDPVWKSADAYTGEWQLLTFTHNNYGTAIEGDMSWKAYLMKLADPEDFEVGETIGYIAWAGVYQSVEDAQEWFDYTTPESRTNAPLSCTTAGIRKTLDNGGDQGLRFYQTLKTKLIGDKEYVTYNDEMLEVKTVHVLMATESTLKSVGLTAEDLKSDLVGNVAKVAQIKVTNCRSRVVDGDNVTYTFTAMLTGVGQVNKSTDVCAVAYARCKNAQGEWVEVYGNVQTTSVKTMYKAIGSSKFSSKIQQWMVGRADGLFLDFVSEATMSQVAVNTKSTAISYSAENSAVYISPLEDGVKESNTIHLYPTGDVSVAEYPVFAMRVKLANPDLQYGSFYWRTEASNELYTKVKQSGGSIVWMQRVPGTEMTYEATDGWQIIYTDMSKVHNPLFTGNWEDVMNVMAPMNGKGVTTADGVYIDWMGAFATVEDAHDYANVDWEREEEPVTVLTQEEQNAKNNAWQINNNLSSEMEKISVETYLVDGYDPDTDQYAFRHHPGLAYFQGKWYAGFSNGVSDEDAPGQKMVYSVSENCKDWSDPIDIVLPGVAAMGTENRSAGNTDLTEKGIVATQVIGGFSVVGDRLYFYYTVQEYARSCFDENGVFKGMDGAVTDSAAYRQYGIYTTDGVTWSTPKAVSSLNRYSTLQQSPHGTQQWYSICGFRIHYTDSDIVNHNTVLSSGVMTQEQILSSRERCPGSLTETSYYQSPDGVLHLLCRSETGYIWAATSTDEGKTWSELYPTNFTSASTMFNCIFLPDGRIAWVGSPYYDTRWPLTLYISEDGYNFDKAYILQDEIYEMQEPDPQGWAKGGAFAYPQLLIEGDYLYILYTKQKEVVEICRVKLSNIP